MKTVSFFLLASLCLALLIPFSLAQDACNDGIDNDGDGTVDTADISCRDASDASEVAYGYQLPVSENIEESCFSQLDTSGYWEACLYDHVEELSWLVSFVSPEFVSGCLDRYSSDYYGLQYDSDVPYTRIALADCVYAHAEEYATSIATALDAAPDSAIARGGEICLNVFYDEYAPECISAGELGDFGDECSFDTECASEICDEEIGTCVECESEASCGAYACDFIPGTGTCLESCANDFDCAADHICFAANGEAGVCEPIAETEEGACTSSGDCTSFGAEYYCADGSCAPQVGLGGVCASAEGCYEGICGSNNECVECTDSSQCSSGVCDPVFGICLEEEQVAEEEVPVVEEVPEKVKCATGYTCFGAYACDIVADVCLTSCIDSGDCNTGYGCVSGECVVEAVVVENLALAESCTTDAECLSGICEAYAGTPTNTVCVECDADTDCSSTEACGTSGVYEHTCVACIDSDGTDIFTLGSVVGLSANHNYVDQEDSCSTTGAVREQTCASQNGHLYWSQKETPCTYEGSRTSCAAGICLVGLTGSCASDANCDEGSCVGGVCLAGLGEVCLASDADCAEGTCVGNICTAAEAIPEEVAVVACADATDNDGDGMYDYYGACRGTLGKITSCTDSACQQSCESGTRLQQGGTYLFPDSGCSSLDDVSESVVSAPAGSLTTVRPAAQVTPTDGSITTRPRLARAAEVEKGFWGRFGNWLSFWG